MEETLLKSFMDLGVTGAFLVYLYIKNGRQEKSNAKVAETIDESNKRWVGVIERFSDTQERHTKVLIKVAQKHKLVDEAEDLIKE